MEVGIEKIRVYPTGLKLNLNELAQVRAYDVDHMHRELMVKERGLNPLWEDAVTMAVNAAGPMLSKEDRDSIGLLIVGTETGLDQEKSLSSWVHYFLGLNSSCRHFEIKAACYSGTAALRMAASWLASGMMRNGQKALVITSDQSLHAINKPWEYVGGAAAVAMLISGQPDFLRLEPEKYGVYAHEVSDVIRPLPWIETGNSEHSLFSYMEGLVGAYEDYTANVKVSSFENFFRYNIYHVPFSGISFRAHKQLMRLESDCSNETLMESFKEKTLPSLSFTSRIGASYGGSIFIAMLGLLCYAENARSGDRVGIFSYGSGSCAEFYSTLIGENSRKRALEAGLEYLLDERIPVTISEYEALEHARVVMSQSPDYTPDFCQGGNWYERLYEGKNKLVFKGSKGYYRNYEFS